MDRKLMWVVGIMVISILGLLGFQGYATYLSILENKEIFDRSVKAALRATSNKLEKQVLGDKTLNYVIEMDTLEFESGVQVQSQARVGKGSTMVISHTSNDVMVVEEKTDPKIKTEVIIDPGPKKGKIQTFTYSMTSQNGENVQTWTEQEEDLVVVKRRLEQLKDKEKVFSGVWEELMLEEVDLKGLSPDLVDSVLRNELRESGINLDYNYGVWLQDADSLLMGNNNRWDPDPGSSEFYESRMLPSLFFHDSPMLRIQFPDRSHYILYESSLSLLTTAILLFAMALSFWIVLKRFFSQRKLNELKDDFISNMGHELKTPLTNISLAIESLGEPSLARSREKYLEIIKAENERMMDQVNRVLASKGLEGDQEEQAIFLKPFFGGLLKKFEIQLEASKANCILQVGPELKVLATEESLEVIFSNLLDNALKYGGPSPEIILKAHAEADQIQIRFQDSGPGIPREYHDQVFEKFFRVPSGNVQNVRGTGLGLNLVRARVNKLGGQVELEPSEAGTSFLIKLPAAYA